MSVKVLVHTQAERKRKEKKLDCLELTTKGKKTNQNKQTKKQPTCLQCMRKEVVGRNESVR